MNRKQLQSGHFRIAAAIAAACNCGQVAVARQWAVWPRDPGFCLAFGPNIHIYGVLMDPTDYREALDATVFALRGIVDGPPDLAGPPTLFGLE